MEESNPSTTGSDSNLKNTEFLVSEQEGLQLHLGRNLFQLVALLVCAAIGAILGWLLVDNRPDLGALAGGVLGMIAGTFLSGLVLMFRPPAATSLTLTAFQHKYYTLKRRAKISLLAFIAVLLTLPIVIVLFGNNDSGLAWLMCLTWIVATVGLRVYAGLLAGRVRELKCPACGEVLGGMGSNCNHCGLSLLPDSEAPNQEDDLAER